MNNNIEKRLDYINEGLSLEIAKRLKEPERIDICPRCGENKPTIKIRERNTAYVDKDLNYIECCKECFNEEQEYWKEQWAEYYSDKL